MDTVSRRSRIPMRVVMVKGRPVPAFPAGCEPHTECPDAYLAWHAWAGRMSRTHRQRQCAGCGLLAIWEPRQ